jgi:nucleoside-diphosphate-sugar epimerase
VARAEPDVVIHQMTAIASTSSLKHFDRVFAETNRLRTTGTDHLIAAALATGVRRMIVQSYTGWPNERTGGPLKTEDDPFDPNPPVEQRESMAAIQHIQRAMRDAPLEGVVLRYANFYGHGVSSEVFDAIRKRRLPIVGDGGGIWSWIHVDDAAAATVMALERGEPGIYNIVDDEPATVAEWLPFLAEAIGAKPPRHVPVWVGRLAAGEVGVSMLTRIRGASNAKAKRELGWQPAHASWRDGFRELGRESAGDMPAAA